MNKLNFCLLRLPRLDMLPTRYIQRSLVRLNIRLCNISELHYALTACKLFLLTLVSAGMGQVDAFGDLMNQGGFASAQALGLTQEGDAKFDEAAALALANGMYHPRFCLDKIASHFFSVWIFLLLSLVEGSDINI